MFLRINSCVQHNKLQRKRTTWTKNLRDIGILNRSQSFLFIDSHGKLLFNNRLPRPVSRDGDWPSITANSLEDMLRQNITTRLRSTTAQNELIKLAENRFSHERKCPLTAFHTRTQTRIDVNRTVIVYSKNTQ